MSFQNNKGVSINVSIARLFLDGKNPRFFKDMDDTNETFLCKQMFKEYRLEELANSFAENGFFSEEPLVCVPKDLPEKFSKMTLNELNLSKDYQDFIENPTVEFIVLEGNRRLSTIKILLNVDGIRDQIGASFFPEVTNKEIIDDISFPLVIVYPRREDVSNYLAVKHITGPQKWEAYAKARFINSLVESEKGRAPEKSINAIIGDVANRIGDTAQSSRKIFVLYKLVQQFKNITTESYDESRNFSYLDISISSTKFKDYLGIPINLAQIIDYDNIVPAEKYDNLCKLFGWYFGVGRVSGPVFKDSRDIQSKFLPKILGNDKAVSVLDATSDISLSLDEVSTDLKYVKDQLIVFDLKVPRIFSKLNGILDEQQILSEEFNEILQRASSIKRMMLNMDDLLQKYRSKF